MFDENAQYLISGRKVYRGTSRKKVPLLVVYTFSFAALVPANHPDVKAQAIAQPPIYMLP